MSKKKKTPGQKTGDWMEKIVKRAGFRCEICRREETEFLPLHVHFIDRNPRHRVRKNLAVFCTGCGRNFTQGNPEGLTTRAGLWTFAINRGLYIGMIKPVEGVDPSPGEESKCKTSSPRPGKAAGKKRSSRPPH
jgi:hypothetical protein